MVDALHEPFHAAVAAATAAAAMAWDVAWSLVLGFVLSGVVQAVVSREAMERRLGGEGAGPVARAALYGAASSSCSYASVAVAKSLLAAGAGFAPSLAFMFASTNLVVELGVVLWRLMGWPFALAEWAGGVVLTTTLALLVRATAPRGLVEEARRRAQEGSAAREASAADDDAPTREGATLLARLAAPRTRLLVARGVVADWRMLRGDLALGFAIAGILATLVPDAAWRAVFLQNLAPGWRDVADAAIAPLVAALSFVCSIGNVPLAAALWGGGVGFGGVLAFLYADLLALPLLDAYRRAFGWRAAAYVGGVFYATAAVSGLLVGAAFRAAGLVPARRAATLGAHAFAFDATFFLNLIAAGVVVAIAVVDARHPREETRACCH